MCPRHGAVSTPRPPPVSGRIPTRRAPVPSFFPRPALAPRHAPPRPDGPDGARPRSRRSDPSSRARVCRAKGDEWEAAGRGRGDGDAAVLGAIGADDGGVGGTPRCVASRLARRGRGGGPARHGAVCAGRRALLRHGLGLRKHEAEGDLDSHGERKQVRPKKNQGQRSSFPQPSHMLPSPMPSHMPGDGGEEKRPAPPCPRRPYWWVLPRPAVPFLAVVLYALPLPPMSVFSATCSCLFLALGVSSVGIGTCVVSHGPRTGSRLRARVVCAVRGSAQSLLSDRSSARCSAGHSAAVPSHAVVVMCRGIRMCPSL